MMRRLLIVLVLVLIALAEWWSCRDAKIHPSGPYIDMEKLEPKVVR